MVVLICYWLCFSCGLYCLLLGYYLYLAYFVFVSECIYFTLLYCYVLIVVTVISNLDVVTIRIMIYNAYLCSFGVVLLVFGFIGLICLLFCLLALICYFGSILGF